MIKQIRANNVDVQKVRETLMGLSNAKAWPNTLGIPETHGITVKNCKLWFDRIPTYKFFKYFTTLNNGYENKFTSVERIFRYVRRELRNDENK